MTKQWEAERKRTRRAFTSGRIAFTNGIGRHFRAVEGADPTAQRRRLCRGVHCPGAPKGDHPELRLQVPGGPQFYSRRTSALLHKSCDGRASPFPGQAYPATSVMGVPRAVKPFRTATRTWNSATCRSKSRADSRWPRSLTQCILLSARLRR
jgi:hypothetical protein